MQTTKKKVVSPDSTCPGIVGGETCQWDVTHQTCRDKKCEDLTSPPCEDPDAPFLRQDAMSCGINCTDTCCMGIRLFSCHLIQKFESFQTDFFCTGVHVLQLIRERIASEKSKKVVLLQERPFPAICSKSLKVLQTDFFGRVVYLFLVG